MAPWRSSSPILTLPPASIASRNLYGAVPPGPAAWAMSIDLNACIGCNACIVACRPRTTSLWWGKAQVLREREMHWLRIDRYFEASRTLRKASSSPCCACTARRHRARTSVLSAATVHDSEGLNVMVYNRCVGTRFCSNNCPYKVRRFNFLWLCRGTAPPRTVMESRRDGARARCDGKVLVLHSAGCRGSHCCRSRGSSGR